MSTQKIVCGDLREFCEVCAHLTREGIAFKAHAACLRIIITGY